MVNNNRSSAMMACYSCSDLSSRPAPEPALDSSMCLSYSQSNLHSVMLHNDERDTLLTSAAYVKALFDFYPSREKSLPAPGLAFERGQVLQLVNAADTQWWRARLVQPDGSTSSRTALIPSRARVEARANRRRRHVQWNAVMEHTQKANSKPPTLSLIKTLSRLAARKHTKPPSKSINCLSEHEDQTPACSSYEPVVRTNAPFCRPLVLVGCAVERVADDLQWLHKQLYQVVDGHAVDKIHAVAKQQQHAIVVGELADSVYDELYARSLYPITLSVRAPSSEALVEWQRRMSLSDARMFLQQLDELEQRVCRHLTDHVTGDTPEEISRRVADRVQELSRAPCWLPANYNNNNNNNNNNNHNNNNKE